VVLVTSTDRGKAPTTSGAVTETAVAVSPSDPRIARRARWASLVGTSLESYDFYLFAYFSAFFAGPLFFEPLGAVGANLAALATIGVAFVIRPLGAIIFGHLGDRIGRRTTLIVTITMMGIATGLIGVLPTYEQAGWIGAILLVLLRVLQGVSLGGEWGGAVLIATEHEEPRQARLRRRDAAAGLADRLDPLGRGLPVADALAHERGDLRVGLAHPVPDGDPAAGGLALPAAGDHRDAGVHGGEGCGAARRASRSPPCCGPSR